MTGDCCLLRLQFGYLYFFSRCSASNGGVVLAAEKGSHALVEIWNGSMRSNVSTVDCLETQTLCRLHPREYYEQEVRFGDKSELSR
jgi:hypothetical protein